MKATLFFVFIFNCACIQAQMIKAYATKEDYIENRFENTGNITLRKYQKVDQKLEQSAAYYFWSTDNSLRYQIGRKTFMVEYNDSLYINTYILRNEKNKRLGRGFSKANKHKGIIYFDTIVKESGMNATVFVSVFWAGILGGTLISKSVAQRQPFIFYYYDIKNDSLNVLNRNGILDLLEENEHLLSLYKKEPDPEDQRVIALYAEAFFLQKKHNP